MFIIHSKYQLCHASFYDRTLCHSVVLAMWVVKIWVKSVIALKKQGKENNLSIKLLIFYHQCTIYAQQTYMLSFSSLSLKRDVRLAPMPVIDFSFLMSLLQYLPSRSPLISNATKCILIHSSQLRNSFSLHFPQRLHLNPDHIHVFLYIDYYAYVLIHQLHHLKLTLTRKYNIYLYQCPATQFTSTLREIIHPC